jgi:iron(III) transport system substrate-binding protein
MMTIKKFLCVVSQVIFLLGIYSPTGTAAESLTQVIEGAKKEGTVTLRLKSTFTAKSMERLEKIIKDKFGVALKIQFTPSSSMSKNLSNLIMEVNAGAPPSYDLLTFSTHVIDGMKAGVLERVDWKPLITKDTNPEVILTHPAMRGAITYYNSHQGLMYNSQKVPADKAPRTMKELADPKWKGKVGVNRGTDSWSRRAFLLGRDKVFSELRAILKNGAIQGQYTDLQNRYLLGEIWMAYSISAYMKDANDKGVPTGWQSLDYADIPSYCLVVSKGSKHANAAKLVAVYLASAEGAKFTLEEADAANMFYSGNYEHDIRMQNKKQGIREVFVVEHPKLLEFYGTKEFEKVEKEADLIMNTGGNN